MNCELCFQKFDSTALDLWVPRTWITFGHTVCDGCTQRLLERKKVGPVHGGAQVLKDPYKTDDQDSKVEEPGAKTQNFLVANDPIYDEVPDREGYHRYGEDSDRYPDDDEENSQWEQTESDHFPDYWPGDYESDGVSIMMSDEGSEDFFTFLQVFGNYENYTDEASDSENRMYPDDNSDASYFPTGDDLPDHEWHKIEEGEDKHEKPWFPIDFPSCFVDFDNSEYDENIPLNRIAGDLGDDYSHGADVEGSDTCAGDHQDLNRASSHEAAVEVSGPRSGSGSGSDSGSRISEETIESLEFTWMKHFPSE